MSEIGPSTFFQVAGLLLQSGETTQAIGAFMPLESTLVPVLEKKASAAATIDALAASDAKTIQAQADAVCGLVQVYAKLLINPGTKAQTAALSKSVLPS